MQHTEFCLIGQRAIVGYGSDTDLMVNGGEDLCHRAMVIHRTMVGSIIQHMNGPYAPGSRPCDRFRVVSACEVLDIIIVCEEEYHYVSQRYAEARAQREKYERLRKEVGKIKAYNAFGIAMLPRDWRTF